MTTADGLPLMAYVDPSALISAIFGQQPEATSRKLDGFPILISSYLLEADLRAAFAREDRTFDPYLSSVINRWVKVDRRLDSEMASILEIVPLRALPLWHLASAMYLQQRQALASRQYRLAFITLDAQQETAARELGFFIP